MSEKSPSFEQYVNKNLDPEQSVSVDGKSDFSTGALEGNPDLATKVGTEIDSLPNGEVDSEPGKQLTLKQLFELAEENIDGIIDQLPEFADVVVDTFLNSVNSSVDLGMKASALFNYLAQNGLRKPTKQYEYHVGDSIVQSSATSILENIREAASHRNKEGYEKIKELLKHYTETSEPLRQEYSNEAGTWQHFTQKIESDKGYHIIEAVQNGLFSQSNNAEALLIVLGSSEDLLLDLSQLLPESFTFTPAAMVYESKVFDIESNDYVTNLPPKDLDSYSGMQGAPNDFAARSYESDKTETHGSVAYSDLTKKGGMLSLLHEIAHAWQMMYQENMARKQFEEFYMQLSGSLGYLVLKQDDEYALVYQSIELEKLKNRGVLVNFDRFKYYNESTPGDSFKIPKNFVDIDFVVKTDVLKPLIENYVAEERDAWARAIRVLRFLRKQGFDLEPELKTHKDIEELIHQALETYQSSIEKKVQPAGPIKQFTNKAYNTPTSK